MKIMVLWLKTKFSLKHWSRRKAIIRHGNSWLSLLTKPEPCLAWVVTHGKSVPRLSGEELKQRDKRTLSTREDVVSVQELVHSQESQPDTRRSVREIRRETTEVIAVTKFPFSDTALKIMIFSTNNTDWRKLAALSCLAAASVPVPVLILL